MHSIEQSTVAFDSPTLIEHLEALDGPGLDALPFGVIAMDTAGMVTAYNRFEAALSGLSPERVLGRSFFDTVAPCTNNFMVAHRYETEPSLDSVIDYVFTLRMRPRKVQLRLLKRPGAKAMYLAVRDLAT